MNYEMTLFHQWAAVSANQLKNLNRSAFSVGLKSFKLTFNWQNGSAVLESGPRDTFTKWQQHHQHNQDGIKLPLCFVGPELLCSQQLPSLGILESAECLRPTRDMYCAHLFKEKCCYCFCGTEIPYARVFFFWFSSFLYLMELGKIKLILHPSHIETHTTISRTIKIIKESHSDRECTGPSAEDIWVSLTQTSPHPSLPSSSSRRSPEVTWRRLSSK